MATNYEDKRLVAVEGERQTALDEHNQTYDGMIEQADGYYDQLINNSKEWEKTQTQQQQERTDFTIEQIEQQKEQANKDYIKEQSGAYTDWQKQSSQHGVNAERMAAQGFTGSGYSESSQVSMYNTYQNRVATAREAYNQAVVSYNNAITEAKLQNSSALAQIAYEAMQQQLELSLQGFQYKNQLILDKASQKREIQSYYDGRYQSVLQQINTENALKEEKRQFNANMKLQQAQLEEEKRQFDLTQGGSGGSIIKDGGSNGSVASETGAVSSKQRYMDKKNGTSTTASYSDNLIDLGLGLITEEYAARLAAAGLIEVKRQGNRVVYSNPRGVTRQNVDQLLKLAEGK